MRALIVSGAAALLLAACGPSCSDACAQLNACSGVDKSRLICSDDFCVGAAENCANCVAEHSGESCDKLDAACSFACPFTHE